jgi:cbb3-type cytochrome oxidase subunit 1
VVAGEPAARGPGLITAHFWCVVVGFVIYIIVFFEIFIIILF